MYNGWRNYETWRYVLALDNENNLYSLWRDQLRIICNKHESHTSRCAEFADFLKDLIEFLSPEFDVCNPLFTDLLDCAFQQIDFFEIAESFVADYECETCPF